MKTIRFSLGKENFFGKERSLLETDSINVSGFLYSTGVRAVKLASSRGHIIVLPFRGQQVWDAVFNGRRLTMKSMFKEPRNVAHFIDTYGCFMMHCGARRMGCPSPEDDHPLHGELPYAPYEDVFLEAGENEKGAYIAIGGMFRYNRAFGDSYEAHPLVRLYENKGVFDISMEIKNLSNYPMDLMYMAHINFLPQIGTEIYQSAPWDKESMKIRKSIPSHVRVSDNFLDFLNKLEENPELTRTLRKEDSYDPEICFTFSDIKTDTDGKVRFIQKHHDGSGDYVCYDPTLLDRTTRWIMRTKNQEAFGLALPATCEPEGYTAEKAKGNIKVLRPGGSITFDIETGYLDPDETNKTMKKMNR
jgi:hypothetical protein